MHLDSLEMQYEWVKWSNVDFLSFEMKYADKYYVYINNNHWPQVFPVVADDGLLEVLELKERKWKMKFLTDCCKGFEGLNFDEVSMCSWDYASTINPGTCEYTVKYKVIKVSRRRPTEPYSEAEPSPWRAGARADVAWLAYHGMHCRAVPACQHAWHWRWHWRCANGKFWP